MSKPMDRRGYLLFGAAAMYAGLTSGFREFEPSGPIGRTQDASGLLSIADLGDRERPYFDDDPVTASGTGDDSMAFDSDGGFTMVSADHDGEGGLSITASETGSSDPVTVVEGVPGTELQGMAMTAATYTVDVAADGDWSLTLAQPRSPAEEIREPPARAVGTGDAIVGPLDTTNGALVSAEHDGDGPFSVTLFLEAGTGVFDPETLFETAGEFEESAQTSVAGVAWAVVRTAGSWTLSFDVP